MNKWSFVAAASALAVINAAAYAAPSAKFAAQLSRVQLINEQTCAGGDLAGNTNCGYSTEVLSQALKTANQKDLLIGVSLETLLTTNTLVRSKTGTKDTSESDAKITVTVYVDGVAAEPGAVVFDERNQKLSATLGGIIESCTDGSDGSLADGTIVIADECVVTEEEIELMQRTMGARHFNFVMPNVSSGEHQVKVHAAIDLGANATAGSASAQALVGKGSLVIEEVRATNSPDGILVLE